MLSNYINKVLWNYNAKQKILKQKSNSCFHCLNDLSTFTWGGLGYNSSFFRET